MNFKNDDKVMAAIFCRKTQRYLCIKYTVFKDVFKFKEGGEGSELLRPEHYTSPYRITDPDKDGYKYVTVKQDGARTRLGFPKGSLTKEEFAEGQYESAIRRECIEEIGIDCGHLNLVGVKIVDAKDYSTRYRAYEYETVEEFSIPSVSEGMISGEVDECLWMSVEDMRNFEGFKNVPFFEYFKRFHGVSLAKPFAATTASSATKFSRRYRRT